MLLQTPPSSTAPPLPAPGLREIRFSKRAAVPVSQELKEQVALSLRSWLDVAREKVSGSFGEPAISFDLIGSCAGKAYSTLGLIRLNPEMLLADPQAFENDVLPHELAHLLANHLHGADIAPHGPEWVEVMRKLGVRPERFHAVARADEVGGYVCTCNPNNRLTARQHQKAQAGLVYCCVTCKGPMVYTRGAVDVTE